ncbi:MAG TPA: hypothetical protein VFO76_00350 [Candidatus Kapabacteria bacterium]|nr:hypothetical protein [Candidatus Kapabacteria bacterium]
MLTLRGIIVCFFAAASLTGCSDSSSTQQPASSVSVQELFPLSAGSEWCYDHTTFNADWSIKTHDTIVFSIIDSLVIYNQTYFQVAYNNTPVSYYYYNGKSDLFSVPVPGDYTPFRFFHVPIDAGKELTLYDSMFFDGTDTINSLNVLNHEFSNLPTQVPAGTFPCEKFELSETYGPKGKTNEATEVDYWYSKGVGWVKRETYGSNHGVKSPIVFLNLIEYHIK